ncbi:hypothetical protein DBR45_13705 [Pseudomonas sp. HMWF031]|nr:hypothetical protein DBR45_13705 [Pseudomonas sp. HMWF031]
MPRREVIYNGGGSVLKATHPSHTLRFSTYDDAEEPQYYPTSKAEKARRSDKVSPKEIYKISGASNENQRGKKRLKAQEDVGLRQKISRQREFLLQLSACESFTAKKIPDRIVKCLRDEIRAYGGLKEWADIQRRRKREVGASLAQEAKDWMKNRT